MSLIDSNQFDSSLIGQRQLRIAKLAKLRELGFDPYPAKTEPGLANQEIIDSFGPLENSEVLITGRLMSWREHGALKFSELQDTSGKIQLYIRQDELAEANKENQTLGWEELELVDIGDHVQVAGKVVKTQRGEISILVKTLKILAKSLRPLPDKWHGIKDVEERFRRRYLDMTMNPEVRYRMERRAKFWQAHREFFNSRGFHEVSIPILEHIPGGGDAVPFVTHMNAIKEDFFLRISHELPLKRLIGAGFEKVYDIGARFRNEGLSDEHLPEHVAMEFYWAYADWKDGMQMIQELYLHIMKAVYNGQTKFQIREFDVDFEQEWEQLDFAELFRNEYGIQDIYTAEITELVPLLDRNGVDYDPTTINTPRATDSLWKLLRKKIAGPAFLINHPKFLSPLQKASQDNPNMVERFQPIIAGSELGNGWTEVNDPIDQYERFMEQQQMRDAGDAEAQWLDIDYVEMLEYGMPPTFGYGHSERVFWFLENVTAREGVPFPQLKFLVNETTKSIYPEIDFDSIRGEKQEEQKKTKELGDITSQQINMENLTIPTSEATREFLHKYVSDEYQKFHAEMVAKAMTAVAKHLGEDEQLFEITGLVHDWDFDQWPEEHPSRYDQLQSELGIPDVIVDAIKGHADLNYPRNTKLAQALLACDEFSGLLYAYMKMTGSYESMKLSSIRKKVYKDLKFAAKISREDVQTGITELGIPEEDFFALIRDTFAAAYDS